MLKRDLRYYKDFTDDEILRGYSSMINELSILRDDDQMRKLFYLAWKRFANNEWTYDGATFVNERYSHTIFEVAAFIHDYRNSFGYTSYITDREMLNIMIVLNYPLPDILKRYFFTRLTFINVFRHKVFLKDYVSRYPSDLIRL